MSKHKVEAYFDNGKKKAKFVTGETNSIPTHVMLKGSQRGESVWVERHWHFTPGGGYGWSDNINEGFEVIAGIGWNDGWVGFNDDVRFNGGPGTKFELRYVIKFSDGNLQKSNALKGQIQ